MVISDFKLLSSLSDRDKRNGYVEAVKVALIHDLEFYEWIEQQAANLAAFKPNAMEHLIYRCAELHAESYRDFRDPFEFGSARPLDFGHWAAHKLEQLSEYRIRHGEAVAVGIALDVIYGRRMGFMSAADTDRILNLLENLGFELFANEHFEDESGTLQILTDWRNSRALGRKLTITLLAKALGQGSEVNEMNLPLVIESINELRDRQAGQERNHPGISVNPVPP